MRPTLSLLTLLRSPARTILTFVLLTTVSFAFFMLDSAWNTTTFLEVAEPLFEEMGLRLIFNDKGWPAIQEAYRLAGWLSAINIAVFSLAVSFATGFVVYLFIGRKKKEYAISRALGAPPRAAARALLLPLMTIAIVSVSVGIAAAWVYTVRTIGRTNAMLALRDYAVNPSIPAPVIVACVAGELLLTLLLALAMLRRIGNASPLALLQGGSRGSA